MRSKTIGILNRCFRLGSLLILFIFTWFAVSTAAAQAYQPEWTSISLTGGGGQTCVLINGAVRCWGFSVKSGVPGSLDHPVPVAVNTLPAGIQQIASGNTHTCAITAASGVKCWGYNQQGMLGNGTYDTSQTPVDVIGLAGAVKSIGMGYTHSCAVINATGAVQCWGLNANGELGNTMGGTYNTPVNVTGLTGVKKVIGGGAHTCALLNSGALKCWGYGYYGQLGNGTSGNPADTYIPQDVTGLDHGVVDVAAGYLSTCALLDTGQVKCWGLLSALFANTPQNVAGLESGVTSLVMGSDHLCTLHAGGQVKCLGGNDSGQLGDGTNSARMNPVTVPGLESGVVSLGAGLAHNCAAFNNGQLHCWGSDGTGELGIGTTTAAIQPWPVATLRFESLAGLATGSNYTCAFNTSGKLYCWGLNNSGNLGTGAPDFMSYPLPQVVSGIPSGASQVAAGTHTCAVVNGAAKCWGRNDVGQLGNGTQETASTPVQVSGLTSGVSKISVTPYADQAHTCAVVNGAAYCWGGNFVGQLGIGTYGDNNGIHTPQAVVGLSSGVTDIASGAYHSCAVANGAAYCWGLSYYGQLGNGDYGDYDKYPTPQPVTGLGNGVTAIVTGSQYSCAVVGGAAKCWGRNQAGQLGNGTNTDAATPVQVSGLTSGVTAISAGDERACAVKDGEVYCWGGGNNSPYKVSGLTAATAVSASYHACALNPAGMACWGSNQYGQLGDGRPFQSKRIAPVLGFGPQPELRINAAQARPGSPLRLVGANFPANSMVVLKLAGQSFCSFNTGPDGFFPAVLITDGTAAGYYEVTALSKGVQASVGFTLSADADLLGMQGGGPACQLPAAPEPTPQPTPTIPPGTSLPTPVVQSVQPSAGDAALMGQIEVRGANFQPGAVVRLGNIPAIQTIYNDSSSLTALIPGGLAAATYNVTVLNPDWNAGTLASAYTAMIINPVSPGVQNDLYAHNYELSTENLYETVNQPTTVWFTLRRLGGSAALNNIVVRFYVGHPGLTDPAAQASQIGQKTLSGLAVNGKLVTSFAWTPTQEGSQELYAVIDPANAVAEKDETNNMVHSWLEVKPPQVVDNTPPVVTSVSAPLVMYQPYAELQVQASDDAGGSGVSWVNCVVWEYCPSLRAWLMTQETGWQFMADGAVKHLGVSLDGFSGARYLDVWVADGQNNISQEPYSLVVNYIEPDNFIFQGESQFFLFPMQTGDVVSASLTNLFSTDDADLYLWPPDYPTHNYWYSAHDAGYPEALNATAPLNGFYWLEVYGYDFAFYNLTASFYPNTAEVPAGPVEPLKPLRTTQLVSGTNLPVENYKLQRLPGRIFMPLIRR